MTFAMKTDNDTRTRNCRQFDHLLACCFNERVHWFQNTMCTLVIVEGSSARARTQSISF